MFRRSTFVVAILSILSVCALLTAQSTTGRIVGNVNDESGAVIPGVEITVRNPATGLVRNAVTNESGGFAVPLLPPAIIAQHLFRRVVTRRSGHSASGMRARAAQIQSFDGCTVLGPTRDWTHEKKLLEI